MNLKSSSLFAFLLTLFFTYANGNRPNETINCPNQTINYNNESCYIFIGQEVTAKLWTEIWIFDPKKHLPQWRNWADTDIKLTPDGYSLGDTTQLSLAPCVWDRDQAERVCEEFHKANQSLYGHLTKFSKKWHLPVLEKPAEDEWLHDKFVSMREKMGTSFWIDLRKTLGKYSWPKLNEEAFWIRRPAGIDRWWERCNVLMLNTTPEETMCYEFHTNYESTRKPYLPMDVMGWHPRKCHGAYEEESDLDSDEDFTTDQLSEAEAYWNVPVFTNKGVGHIGKRCYYGDENFCVIPEVKPDGGGRNKCEDPVKFVRGKYRMRLAPISVVCEANIDDFADTDN